MVESLLASIRHPLVILNTDLRIRTANPRFYETFSLPPGEVVGRPFFQLLEGSWEHPELRAWLDRHSRESGSDTELEVELKAPGGTAAVLRINARRAGLAETEGPSFILAFEVLESRSEELYQTSRLLRAVADSTADAIFVKDLSGKYLFFNEAAARFVGRPVEEVLGRDDTALFDPEGARLLRERDRRVMETGEMLAEEERLTAAGTTRVYHAVKTPYRDEQGNVIGLIGISRDITERKWAEEALQASEERYRAMLQDQTEVVCRVRADHMFLFANQAFCRLLGKSESEIVGLRGRDITHPEDVAHVEAELSRMSPANPIVCVENRVIDANGEARWMEFVNRGFFAPEGELREFQVVGRDITRRKRAEEALSESEERFRVFMDNCPAAAFIKDEEGRFLYVNAAWRRQFDPEPVEWLGKTDYDFWPREVAELFRSSDRECLAQGQPLHGEESGELPGSGERRTWLVLKFPLECGRGRRVGGMAWDVTEQRQLQAEFLQAQKMESIGRLAGGIAHDFNNMLAVINGYSQMVLRKLPAQHPLRDSVEEIGRAGERAAGLTRQLLAFSRRQLVEPRVLDLNQVLVDLDKMLRRLIGEDIELVTAGATEPLRVRADAAQLEQVIVNLAVNARDAMPTGGRLTLTTRSVLVEAGQLDQEGPVEPGRYVMLEVRDTGIGIAPEYLSHLFEPFFTTKETGKGTGLGLSTVYGIVKQAGGFLRVESYAGHGSCFSVYLPQVEAPAPADRNQALPDLPRGSETILVVEDEPMVRGMICDVLRRSGYTVLEARHAEEALHIAQEHPGRIHLLLTDVVMPRMSGPALAGKLTSLRPETRVLFVSGYTDDAVIRHGVQAQEVELLQKPFTMQDLTERVRQILEARRAMDDRRPSLSNSRKTSG